MDLIYPPRCPICHDIVQPGYQMVCGSCLKKLPLVLVPKCEKCGKPVPDGDGLCYDCTVIEHSFTEGMGVFLYEEVMRKSMHYFKYGGRKEYGAFYGTAAWFYGKDTLKRWNPQVIIPIPIHKTRLRTRGYNQAEIIADVLSGYMGVPVLTNLLVRQTKTTAQKELTVEERRQNLENAFAVSEKNIDLGIFVKNMALKKCGQGSAVCTPTKPISDLGWEKGVLKRVLLLDDIYTTGSTMDSAANELKKCGIEEIYALSICIGKGFVIQ